MRNRNRRDIPLNVKRGKIYKGFWKYKPAKRPPYCRVGDTLQIQGTYVNPHIYCINNRDYAEELRSQHYHETHHEILGHCNHRILKKLFNESLEMYMNYLRKLFNKKDKKIVPKFQHADMRIMELHRAANIPPEISNIIVSDYLQALETDVKRPFKDYLYATDTQYNDTYYKFMSDLAKNNELTPDYVEFIEYFKNFYYKNLNFKNNRELQVVKKLYQKSVSWKPRTLHYFGSDNPHTYKAFRVKDFGYNPIQFFNMIFIYWYFLKNLGEYPDTQFEFLYLIGGVLHSDSFDIRLVMHAISEIIKSYTLSWHLDYASFKPHPHYNFTTLTEILRKIGENIQTLITDDKIIVDPADKIPSEEEVESSWEP